MMTKNITIACDRPVLANISISHSCIISLSPVIVIATCQPGRGSEQRTSTLSEAVPLKDPQEENSEEKSCSAEMDSASATRMSKSCRESAGTKVVQG